jgi:hypothetical protein
MQQVERNRKQLLHPTIHMYAEQFELLAAIGPAGSTRRAKPTAQVGVNGATIAGSKSKIIRRRLDDHTGQFVAYHPGKSICGMASSESVKVTSANAHLADLDQSLPRARACGRRHIARFEFSWLSKDNLLHLPRALYWSSL